MRNTKFNYKKYKEHSLYLIHQKIIHFNTHYNFKINKVFIKNQKTRWGSCSTKGNLNFNYKVALIPEHLTDYVVVHEICHLGQFNHSPKFWALVAQTIPDYKKRRRELKKLRM
jgi:predicted metal-dependent hydrolase